MAGGVHASHRRALDQRAKRTAGPNGIDPDLADEAGVGLRIGPMFLTE